MTDEPEDISLAASAAVLVLRDILDASSPARTATDRNRVAFLRGAIAALEMVGRGSVDTSWLADADV